MEMVKNMVYAGVGLATMTTEKVKETIDELVEKGRISDTEGKKIVDDFFSSTEKRREEFETKFKSVSDKLFWIVISSFLMPTNTLISCSSS